MLEDRVVPTLVAESAGGGWFLLYTMDADGLVVWEGGGLVRAVASFLRVWGCDYLRENFGNWGFVEWWGGSLKSPVFSDDE